MDKKLLLINPVNTRLISSSGKKFKAFSQPLGLGIVAALTPDDWEVEIIDEHIKPFEYQE
ncbi:MAG: radical SAM protein, partial [Proteobacteria bacterium]|nr:radical SAM protein [Pseudomonadota bacterium]